MKSLQERNVLKLRQSFVYFFAKSHLVFVCFLSPGNVWIYSIYRPDFQKNSTSPEMYCNKTLYLYAFWTTTLVYILFAVVLLGGCCVLVCFCLCGRADPDDDV